MSDLIEQANLLKPQFKSTNEAIDFYSKALEKICSTNEKTIQDFLMNAETQVEYNSEHLEALSLSRMLKSLKTIG